MSLKRISYFMLCYVYGQKRSSLSRNYRNFSLLDVKHVASSNYVNERILLTSELLSRKIWQPIGLLGCLPMALKRSTTCYLLANHGWTGRGNLNWCSTW